MSNYIKATNFRIKDTLVTGDPNKRIKGTEIDDEYVAIATSISSKSDSASPTLTGTPTAPTPSPTDDSSRIATTAFVQYHAVPVGGIIMWGGLVADIPSNYALCNGSGGTPNLKDRFILGSGDVYAVGATGGSKDAVVVEHTHTIVDAGHAHGVENYAGLSGGSPAINAATVDNAGAFTTTATTGIVINTTGVVGTDKNLPPYYALAFIQRVS